MDESKPDRSSNDKGVETQEKDALTHSEKHHRHTKETHGLSDDIDANTPVGDVKGPNVFERVKEEFEAIREAIHHKDDKNHGSPSSVERDDVSLTGSKHEKKSSLSGPKSPVSHHKETHGRGDDIDANTPVGDVKGPNVFERVKEEFEAIREAIHHKDDKSQGSPSSVERDGASLTGSKHEKKSSLSEEPKSPVSHHKETHGRGDDIDADIPISEFKGPSIFHRAKEEIEALVDTIHSKKDSDHAESPKKEGGFRASIKGKLHKIRNRD
ncbi:hypothetical protein CTI12_AA378960 [Artemisia annua]|uniref:Uncharacterized protein n=1 Tax=Artemisia annua TaxID=35608 RepID=A0A2U1MHT7_ARTAN|nr:hypothetical protein CTI12_AA378960 [Artemisia annua]